MEKQLIIGILLALVLVVSGCVDTDGGSTVEVIKEGDHVLVDYTGRLEDGTVFDTSVEDVAIEAGVHNPNREYQPIGFTVGAGQMIKGFDRGVVGMAASEEKTLTISPEDSKMVLFSTRLWKTSQSKQEFTTRTVSISRSGSRSAQDR